MVAVPLRINACYLKTQPLFHSSLLKKPEPPKLKETVAVRQVMGLSSAVKTSASTLYLP